MTTRHSGAWALGAVAGPITGPLIGGFAAQANGWKWPIWELLWISSFAFLVLFFLLPETLESTILLRRAERLRKLTGNQLIKTRTELDRKEGETFLDGRLQRHAVRLLLVMSAGTTRWAARDSNPEPAG